ncbi:carbohydrate-binding protein [Acidovorax sp. NCPPB 3576]|uniref:carbohydrate-binding protein n=1 Tax=Acidovorax sp. NCPPB 3576 TaxID=2940488 RepID=UPI0023497BBD|nr:carbohydrate-binding protein [Acidovorax sp. NCPPB 3576]WCM86644.1 carbohydrate-binding protein [Acidovorax sp. NCPPB 3576]WCM88851.1 carbohydrate-binding protein [Acidovorax sp. NCPPB 3576]
MSIRNLNVVRPLIVTAAMLVSTNVAEADYPAWSSGTTYAAGARVIHVGAHKVFQSTQDGNVGKDPTTTAGFWVEVGATNRWKVFDRSVSSQTAQASTIQYRLRPGQAITSLSALNLIGATSMRVRVIDPTYGTVYDKTVDLSRVPVSVGWWEWFFGERRAATQAVLMDIPSFPGADVLIDFTGSALLAVGVLLLGQLRTFGLGVKSGARVGIQDYSRKERTEFGDVVVVERAFAKRASFSLLLTAAEVDAFNAFLAEVRAKPCLWIGSGRYESTTVYGFYKSFDIVISYYDYADSELELEGLT